MKEDCFAFRYIPAADGKGYRVKNCDCLTELVCRDKDCRFYKNKDTVKQYQFKSSTTNNKYAIGYVDL